MASSEVISMRVEDSVAVLTLGSPTRIYFDPEMSDALLEAMTALAGDEAVRVVVVTGGAPGYFVRHYSVATLISMVKGSRVPDNNGPKIHPILPAASPAQCALPKRCRSQLSRRSPVQRWEAGLSLP